MTDLSSPTKFHPDWNVPPGMDWKDYNTISLNPKDYTNLQGLPANHFEMAIKNGYDFYAITDHSQEPNLQPVSVNNPAWQTILKTADKYNDYPDFVALSGFEYSRNTTVNGGAGHINVINSSEYVNADHGQRGPAPPWPEANWSIPQFYNWLKSAQPHNEKGFVVAGFNHPQPNQYNDWDNIDSAIVKLISTFEIHTNYGPIRWKAYIRALNMGWKVSPIGVLDNPDTCNFQIEVKTRYSHPNERVRCIQILRNSEGEDNVKVAAEKLFDGNKDKIIWNPVIEDTSAKYFLLRIYHTNDMNEDGSFKLHGSTISAPIWTGR